MVVIHRFNSKLQLLSKLKMAASNADEVFRLIWKILKKSIKDVEIILRIPANTLHTHGMHTYSMYLCYTECIISEAAINKCVSCCYARY